MHTEELVRSWKQPSSLRSKSIDHPSGEITLRSSGRLARKHGLMAPSMDFTTLDMPTLTASCPLTPASEPLDR